MSAAVISAGPGASTTGSLLPRILVIEDDEGMVDVIARALGRERFELTTADRGMLGLEYALTGEFSLVVLDLHLPDIDGLSLLTQLLEARPEQEILILSALSSVEAKVRCLELGAADYLPKPFALDELVARVGARIRSAQRDQPWDRFRQAGGLTLDLQRRVAVCRDQIVALSTREFHLLEYLMRRRGEVCTRKEILETVWNCRFDPGTNVVDVYVRRLRRKISDLGIETIRNVGYSFQPA